MSLLKRRLKLRFGLRWLLVMVTVVAVLLAREKSHYQAQKQLVAMLESKRYGRMDRMTERWVAVRNALPWLNDMLSVYVTKRLSYLRLGNNSQADVLLRNASVLGTLKELNASIDWSDQRIRCFRRFSNLEAFVQSSPSLNDDMVVALARCKSLEGLAFDGTGVSSDALLKLGRLRKLRCLSLRGEVESETLSELRRRLPNTYVLYFGQWR